MSKAKGFSTMKDRITIMAHDPGSKNYGLAVVTVELDRLDRSLSRKEKASHGPVAFAFTIRYLSKSSARFTDLKKPRLVAIETWRYLQLVQRLTRRFKVNLQIAERYMSRRMGGVTIELVNMMLGTLRAACSDNQLSLRLIPASQWKNEAKRRGFQLDDVYRRAKPLGVSDHEIDAIFIALYGAYTLMRRPPFFVKSPEKLVDALIRKLETLKDC